MIQLACRFLLKWSGERAPWTFTQFLNAAHLQCTQLSDFYRSEHALCLCFIYCSSIIRIMCFLQRGLAYCENQISFWNTGLQHSPIFKPGQARSTPKNHINSIQLWQPAANPAKQKQLNKGCCSCYFKYQHFHIRVKISRFGAYSDELLHDETHITRKESEMSQISSLNPSQKTQTTSYELWPLTIWMFSVQV